ncbi:hypothetical protein ES705_39660 [subsurface metagenome]
MDSKLLQMVVQEEVRGTAKWGGVDKSPSILLNAATEELGEVAHAINHEEGSERISQEIAETMGVLSRLYDMVIPPAVPASPIGEAIEVLTQHQKGTDLLYLPRLPDAEKLGIEALKLLSSADFSGGAHTFKGQSVEECIFIRKSDLEAGPFADLLKG